MKRAMWVWLAVLCLASGGAAAQDALAPATQAVNCPANGSEMPLETLFGEWEARFDGIPGVAKVQLAKHPDYAGVRGTITRIDVTPATVAQLAGDVDDQGMLSLDESMDGHAISGVWLGELAPGSCGKEWRGVWRNAADDSNRPFTLNKVGNSGTER
jgi:hypothetical protein